jgi:hypothetical protein
VRAVEIDHVAGKALTNLITLSVLTLAASLALASCSIWLLLPYWGLMAWLVSEPARNWVAAVRRARQIRRLHVATRPSVSDRAAPRTFSNGSSASPLVSATADVPTSPELSEAGTDATTAAVSNEPPETSGRRGRAKSRARARSGKDLGLELARWVRVGPGKFVRVDAATIPACDGSAEESTVARAGADTEPAPDGLVECSPEQASDSLNQAAAFSESTAPGLAADCRNGEAVRNQECVEPAGAAMAWVGTDLPQVESGCEAERRCDEGSPPIASGAQLGETFDGESRTPLDGHSGSNRGFATAPLRERRGHAASGRSQGRDRGHSGRRRTWPDRSSLHPRRSVGPRSCGRGQPWHPQRGPPPLRRW